jgi:hypothetical protein
MDRWYSRTEFWFSLAGVVGGFIQTQSANSSTGELIGGLLVAISTAVYTWGRSNVKAKK